MKSALKDFLVCTIRQRDALRQALREDAHAMTYAELVARHRRAGKSDAALAGESPEVFLHPRQSPAGDAIPPYTTENDVLRFELTRGIKDEPACLPPSRTALAAAKFRPSYGEAEFQKLFRLAVAEAQRNGTVAVVLPLLKAVLDCHERFITAAVSEADDRDTTGSGVEFVELLNAQAALMPFRPIPTKAADAKRATSKETARERLLEIYKRGERFTSYRELAQRLTSGTDCTCSLSTIRNAIAMDDALLAWSQQASQRKGAPVVRAALLNPVHMNTLASEREADPSDFYPPDDVDRKLKELISQAVGIVPEHMRSEKRRELETYYEGLPPEERERHARAYDIAADDDYQKIRGHRA